MSEEIMPASSSAPAQAPITQTAPTPPASVKRVPTWREVALMRFPSHVEAHQAAEDLVAAGLVVDASWVLRTEYEPESGQYRLDLVR